MLEFLIFSCLLTMQGAGEELPPALSLISALPVRNIMFLEHGSGSRMGDMAVYEKDPNIFYYASCNGGVVKTTDGGKTCKYIFDKVGSCSIGCLAMSQKNPDVLWVGTGDKWQRNTVGMGDGIYKTTDGGKTWKCMGLKNSNSIGRISIDPTNENIVFVAVLGSPWGYGPDRGVYKTTDGGNTWRKVLYHDEKSGANAVVVDPKNPKNVIASLYDHIHYPYGWFYGGPGSGIYRSTDGGETWKKMTKGLPSGKIGRIDLDIYRKDPRQVVAIVEYDPKQSSNLYRSWDGGETWKMMPLRSPDGKEQRYPFGRSFYDLGVRFDPQDSNKIYFNALSRTTDGGMTADGGGGDVHGVWIDPNNSNHGIGSTDWGMYQSWNIDKGSDASEKVFTPNFFQTYGVGYDMRKLYNVMGNSQDEAAFAMSTQSRKGILDGSEHYHTGGDECGRSMADPEDWTTVYGAKRSRGLTRADLKTGEIKEILLGIGGYVNAFENPGYLRSNPRLRASWYTEFQLSPWNSKTIYIGANHLFKSTDRGDHWEMISPDLTHNNPAMQQVDEEFAYEPMGENSISRSYQTIVTICESPLMQGLIWCGTDDGYVQLTQDGGKTWTNVTANIPGLPEYSWCSRIDASRFVEGRAYAAFNNHRYFDLKSYVYVTEDYGKSWKKITSNLPDEPCRAIKEGLKNPDLLFLGTEFGLYISLDRGQSWDYYQDWKTEAFGFPFGTQTKGYFPRVAVYDLQIHPRELDLIIGSHGRGIWTLPIRALEEMTPENRAKDVYFATPGNVYLFPLLNPLSSGSLKFYMHGHSTDNTQPGTLLSFYLKHNAQGKATIKFQDAQGNELMRQALVDFNGLPPQKVEIKAPAKAGLNSIQWMNDGLIRKPGDYRVVLTIDGKEYVQKLHVEDATDEVLAGMKAIYPKKQEEMANNRD